MKNILVTGGQGQLALCIKDLSQVLSGYNFMFLDYKELDITNKEAVSRFFQNINIDYCVNCAAYTAVDNAEKDKDKAYAINTLGAKNLALVCKTHNSVLIHISTDFVFEGIKTKAYNETDEAKPISVYGETKLKGEIEIRQILSEHFIIRTSWLYSEHGNNFMKTMLRLSKDKDSLSIIRDQIGTPTYAGDLAQFILNIINIKSPKYGTYHYSNIGELSWFDFAKAIFKESKINIKLKAIEAKDYPMPAKRPIYSVLDKTKTINVFNFRIPEWRDSLSKCLKKMDSINS